MGEQMQQHYIPVQGHMLQSNYELPADVCVFQTGHLSTLELKMSAEEDAGNRPSQRSHRTKSIRSAPSSFSQVPLATQTLLFAAHTLWLLGRGMCSHHFL